MRREIHDEEHEDTDENYKEDLYNVGHSYEKV